MKNKLFLSIIFVFTLLSCKGQELGNVNIVKTIEGTEAGVLINGKKQGNWIYYDKTNILYKLCFYKDDMLNGKYIKFNPNGNILMTLDFESGRINGVANFYSSKGILLATYIYSNDIIKEIKYYVIDNESPPRNHDFIPNL